MYGIQNLKSGVEKASPPLVTKFRVSLRKQAMGDLEF